MTTEQTNLTLTPADIADVAAYWGAECEGAYSNIISNHKVVPLFKAPIDDLFLGLLCESTATSNTRINSFTLHLKPLSALTDEELITLFGLAFEHPPWRFNIEREDGFLGVSVNKKLGIRGLYVWHNGRFSITTGSTVIDPAIPYGPIIRQLQRWGYYVPGTIRKELVTISQP